EFRWAVPDQAQVCLYRLGPVFDYFEQGAAQRVVVQCEQLKPLKVGQGGRDAGQLVAVKVEPGKADQVPDPLGQARQLVLAQVQLSEVAEVAKRVRQAGQPISV